MSTWTPPQHRAPPPPMAPPTTRQSGGAKARKGGAEAEAAFAEQAERWARADLAHFGHGGPRVRYTGERTAIVVAKGTVDALGVIAPMAGGRSIPCALDIKSTAAGSWSDTNSTLRPHERGFLQAYARIPGAWGGVLVCLRRDTAPEWWLRRFDSSGRLLPGRRIDLAKLPAEVCADCHPVPYPAPAPHSDFPAVRLPPKTQREL